MLSVILSLPRRSLLAWQMSVPTVIDLAQSSYESRYRSYKRVALKALDFSQGRNAPRGVPVSRPWHHPGERQNLVIRIPPR
jgi:hypothetical protein